MDVKKKVGIRIKELRIKAKLTQEGLSDVSGIDRTYISDVENGRRNISIVTLETLLNSLNIKLSKFFSTSNFK